MAEEQIVTHIVANADFSNLIADVNRVTASLSEMQQKLAASNKALDNQIKVINNSFAETLRSTGQYSTHFVTLTSDVEKFGKNLDTGRLKLRDYFKVYQDHQKTSSGLIRDLAKQQVQLQNAILQPLGRNAQGLMQFNVHVPRGLDLIKNKTNLAKLELQIMNKVIQDGAVQLINWGKNTQWAGRQLTVGLTVPLAMFGKAAADAFKQADQELTRLTKVYGDVAGTSAQDLTKIRNEVAATAKELSASMGVGFNETIALAADIAATGKTGNDLLGALTETTRLAVLGEVDRAEAMKATLAIQTAFKQNTEELSASINFLNAVENQTSTSLNDLVEAIPKAGPVVKQLGGDIQDLALYLTAMREGGINASESANALKSGLASLINPTKQTVGVMSDFGINILEMVNKNAGNTTSLLFDLQAALDNLDPLQKAQAIEQLFGKFQFARISALLNNLGRQGSQTLQVLDLMGESAGNLEAVAGRELAAVTESASGRYRRAIEGLKADLAGVGEQFLNISTNLINFVDGIVDFANKLPRPVKSALALVGGITALAGPLIMLTGVLANFFGYIVKGLSHMRALFKGGEGFKLLTPEMLAAERAGSLIEKTFYNDAQAASVLNTALKNLIDSFTVLESKAAAGQFSVAPAISTIAGSPIVAASAAGRVVDPDNPFLGRIGSRASAHMNPRDPDNPATMFGLVPSTGPVNLKVGKNPMSYSMGDIPGVKGLTTFNGVSAGIYAPEAARWHALMATLGMQTRQEMESLKDTIAAGGTVSKEIMTTFDDILPLMSSITDNAAKQTALIVSEMQAGKLTIAQARERIMALNAQVEAELVRTAQMFAASRGRTIDVTKVPGLDQPVVDLSGKSNMRELFHKGRSARMMEALGRATRTRMYGGPYNIETTKPQGLNRGGKVYTMAQGNIVPGPNVNADVVPALLTPGEFVVNREATARNLPLLRAINGTGSRGPGFNGGTKNPLAGLQRGHISSDLSAFLMYMDTDVNQRMVRGRTYQGFDGITGLEIARSFETMQDRTGIHPASILKQLAYEMGGDPSLVDDFYSQLIKDLKSPENATKVFGGTRGASFESFADQRLARLRLITLPDGRNLHDELRRVRTIRSGRTIGLEMDGKPYGGSNVLPVAPSRRAPRQSRSIGRAFLGTRGGFRGSQISRLFRFNDGGMVPGNSVLRYHTGGGPIPELKFGEPIDFTFEGPAAPTVPISELAKQNKQISPMLGNLVSMGTGMAGSALGSRFGMVGNMVGFLAGQAAGTALMNRLMGESVQKTSMLSKAFTALSRLPGPLKVLGAVAGIALAVKSVNDRINEHRRIVDQGFAPTEDTVKKLNLQFEKTSDVLKKAQENMRAMQETGQALYRSNTNLGVPGVSLTIEQFDELSQRIKNDFPDLIEVFNKAKPEEVLAKAQQLKAQFVAGGMSAKEATDFIYTLIKSSNDATMALTAISSQGFRSITDGATAAKSALQTFESLASSLNIDQIPEAFDTARIAINEMKKDLIGTKDPAGKIRTEADALEETMRRLKEISNINVQLSADQLEELKKQNPVLYGILGTSEDLQSVYAKTELYVRGITNGLKELSAEAANAKLELVLMVEAQLKSAEGPFKSLANQIKNLEKSSNNEKITRSIQKNQDALKKEIELRQKNIDKIKQEADARLEALDRERNDEDALLEIKKLQLQYQNELSSGNLDKAAQTAIDIQRRVGDQQTELARRAIEDDANKRINKEKNIIEGLQKQLDNAQNRIDKANQQASDNAKKLSEYQDLMARSVQAAFFAEDGLTKFEKEIIDQLRTDLAKAGFKDIADAINPNPTPYTGKRIDGRTYSPTAEVTKLFEDQLRQAYDSGSNAIRVVVSNPEEFFNTKGKTQMPTVTPSQGSTVVMPSGKKKAIGGLISGPGTGTSDSIPIWASNGEYMFSAKAVKNAGGPSAVDAMHEYFKNANKMKEGGPIRSYFEKIAKQNKEYNGFGSGLLNAGPSASIARIFGGMRESGDILNALGSVIGLPIGRLAGMVGSKISGIFPYLKTFGSDIYSGLLSRLPGSIGLSRTYHGGPSGISAFRKQDLRGWNLPGTYLTQDPISAAQYAAEASKNAGMSNIGSIYRFATKPGEKISVLNMRKKATKELKNNLIGIISKIESANPKATALIIKAIENSKTIDEAVAAARSFKLDDITYDFEKFASIKTDTDSKIFAASGMTSETFDLIKNFRMGKTLNRLSELKKDLQNLGGGLGGVNMEDDIQQWIITNASKFTSKEMPINPRNVLGATPQLQSMIDMFGLRDQAISPYIAQQKIANWANYFKEVVKNKKNPGSVSDIELNVWAENMLQGIKYSKNKISQKVYEFLTGETHPFNLKNMLGASTLAMGGYIDAQKMMPKPKFHNWNGVVPGPYNQEISATLKAGTEGVYQQSYINSLKNDTMGSTIINVDKVVMKFPETPENGKQMFAEFKEAIRVENLKKGGTVRI